ncbi:MAG: hydroxymethylbilane synthase, partial [Bacteroidales bacterium]|nr:hydroxymethylbilane synthase [Bacteroidales bacterium]
MKHKEIVIGTRGSQLALYQANRVKEEIEKHYPQQAVALKIIKTKGDKILDVALSKIGDKGLFTKELEVELINGSIDIAVHSLKDLPTQFPDGLALGGVLERGEFRDALVHGDGKKLHELDEKDIIATSSLRRRALLLSY